MCTATSGQLINGPHCPIEAAWLSEDEFNETPGEVTPIWKSCEPAAGRIGQPNEVRVKIRKRMKIA